MRRWFGKFHQWCALSHLVSCKTTHILELDISQLSELGDSSMRGLGGHVELHQAHLSRAVEGLVIDANHAGRGWLVDRRECECE